MWEQRARCTRAHPETQPLDAAPFFLCTSLHTLRRPAAMRAATLCVFLERNTARSRPTRRTCRGQATAAGASGTTRRRGGRSPARSASCPRSIRLADWQSEITVDRCIPQFDIRTVILFRCGSSEVKTCVDFWCFFFSLLDTR